MTITEKNDGALTTLIIDGRVDTTTSPNLQSAILQVLQSNKGLILDFSAVPYLSSAGLRALLIGQKTASAKKLTFEMHAVKPPVLKVLESVGFHKVLTINPSL